MTGLQVHIRKMQKDDVLAVSLIEREVFSLPWSYQMLEIERKKPTCRAYVALCEGVVSAHLLATTLADVDHIMTFAVAPAWQRRGIAAKMLGALFMGTNERRYTLEVRPSNQAALRLYAKHGFLVAGIRRRYYADDGEDALVMWRTPATLQGRLDDVPGLAVDDL